jgi:hypothetical protein
MHTNEQLKYSTSSNIIFCKNEREKMLQTNLALSPELTHSERHQAIRQAFHNDRTQMTLMLAHRVRVAEVEILRSLEGDTAHELDFSRWEEIIHAFESLSFEFFDKRGQCCLQGLPQLWWARSFT